MNNQNLLNILSLKTLNFNSRNLLGTPQLFPAQQVCRHFFCAQTAVARPWQNCEIRAASHDSTTTPGERWFQANNSSPLI